MMKVLNNTHYHTEYTRVYNQFPDPDSFQFESGRRMGYFQRLYYEFLYTQKVNGIAFFYTLTYNNKSLHTYLGKPCFYYPDIRLVTNGRLSKVLLRKYGSRLRYFCACESGEGKGIRGLGNNPHYHFIFFVQPVHDSEGNPVYSDYKKISPFEFRRFIYEIWQGSENINWKRARFGHCQEGDNLGEILSMDAFSYVGKYCVKDSSERFYEDYLYQFFFDSVKDNDISNHVLLYYYKFLLETDSNVNNKYDFYDYLKLSEYSRWRRSTGYIDKSLERFLFDYCGAEGQIIISQILDYWKTQYIPQYVWSRISEYRNIYSPKVRMSKNLGEYGLNFIEFVGDSPRVKLHTSSGYKVQYPCLYFIRKLFYNIKKCPITGNPLYYLNERGIDMKLKTLRSNLFSFQDSVRSALFFCSENNFVVSEQDFCSEVVNKENYSHPQIFKDIISSDCLDELIRRYSVYHYIYQFRYYTNHSFIALDPDCSEECYLKDYRVFLSENCSVLDYEYNTIFYLVVHRHLYDTLYDTFSFDNHLAFFEFLRYFKYLDKLFSLVSDYQSKSKKVLFDSKRKHESRLKSYHYNIK